MRIPAALNGAGVSNFPRFRKTGVMLHLRHLHPTCSNEERRAFAVWNIAALAAACVAGSCASAANAQAALRVPNTYPWALRFAPHAPALPMSRPDRSQRDKWPEKVLYTFSGPDGAFPNPLTPGNHGEFYGTTAGGGGYLSGCSGTGCGTVFQLTPPSRNQPMWTETVLYSFTDGADGAYPFARVTLGAHGVLFGTTYLGGYNGAACSGYGCGTVFALTPPRPGQTNWTESVLYAFTGGADGGSPGVGLTEFRGSLYGTTATFGPLNAGVAFRVSPPQHGQTTWTQTVIHAFGAPGDGASPSAGFTLAGDTLLSTTNFGGRTNCLSSGCGTIYQLTPIGRGDQKWRETIVHEFNGFDGSLPGWEPTLDSSGALYATAAWGGAGGCAYSPGCGAAVKLTSPLGRNGNWKSHVIFYVGPHTGYFAGPLVPDGFGNVFGAAGGGALGDGFIVQLSPHGSGAWKETVLHRFSGADGVGPYGELTIGDNGHVYGTTGGGGNSCACGVAYELKP